MSRLLVCAALLGICALPGIASGECVGRICKVPGVPVPGGGIYACNATLKTLHYTYPSAPGKQEAGDIALSGDQTTVDLPVTGTAKPLR